jgi:O-antigen/teichoic acid export membrane protein
MTPITYAYHRDPSTPGALARMARLYAAGAVVLIAGLAWLGPELVGVLAGTRYSGAIPILPAVAAVPLLAGFANFAPGLALARSTLRMGLIAIAGAVVTTVLNFTLVPRIGIIAAAWSSAIGTGAALLLTISQAQARYRIPWEGVSLASAAAIAIVLALLVPALHSAGIATFPARSGIFASVLVIVALVGLIQGRDLRAIYRSVRRSREREETG